MGSHHPTTRRRSSAQQPSEDTDGMRSLLLSRTRSFEDTSVAESVAVPDLGPEVDKPDETSKQWPRSVTYLLLLCAFLMSLSFGVTQVPILYVYRLMTCDAYYKDHPSHVLDEIQASQNGLVPSIFSYAIAASVQGLNPKVSIASDRCSIRPIESSTAMAVSLLGASTTVFGIANLFLTGSLIKSIGLKRTLMLNIFLPALRLVVQNIGVEVWGSTGIIIIQCSQILTIFGGPSGYLLTLNAYIAEVVDYEGRTAALGRLNGCMFIGSAVGFLLGGTTAESFGIKIPFRLTLLLFLSVCAYVFVFLPHIPPGGKKPETLDSARPKPSSAMGKFLAPLRVFAPRKFVTKEGAVTREYGAFLLAWGVYLGILATGYLVTLLQLYATDVFDFGTKQNGALIFMYSMLRGVFLTFAFPMLIKIGRRWTSKQEKDETTNADNQGTSERQPLLSASQDEDVKKEQTFTFDLTYTKFSLIIDGALTLLCTFVHKGWQMYLVAAILPFGAGTGSAAKGTILQMVGSSATSDERTDALAGVSLVENIARLSTTSIFGVIFAAFASIGRTELVFTCNAAVALIGFLVLLFARFPPEGSRRLDLKDGVVPAS